MILSILSGSYRMIKFMVVRLGTKERCEPEYAHSLIEGPELTRKERMMI